MSFTKFIIKLIYYIQINCMQYLRKNCLAQCFKSINPAV